MCGIVPPERAKRLAGRLMRPDVASGWGLRTRSASDPNYNPMSYHNGSVWPHDNSLVAYGLASCGQWEAAGEISRQLLSATRHYRLFRLPELYCGFGPAKTPFGHPVDYPVSCSPQAWAAGAPYLLLQAILGLEPDALAKTLRVRPHLPPWLGHLEVSNLRVGESRMHLRVTPEATEVVSGDGVGVLRAAES
jgi:glycogen debranching enzyme